MSLSARLALVVSLLCTSSVHQESAMEAITRGRSLKWQMRNQAPFRREAARMGAVHSFRVGVGVGTLEQSAQCVLRAGELLRAGGFGEAAIEEFVRGAGLGSSTWSLRCALTAGKMLTAAGRPAEACRILQRVSGQGVPSRFSESARVQRGVALWELGRTDSAVATWRAVAEDGVTPRARLDAFECWGQRLLDDGDLEGAAGVLHLCRVSLSGASLEWTERGYELRALLQNSRLASAIRRGVHLRHGTGE